jgi:hypothetical protein
VKALGDKVVNDSGEKIFDPAESALLPVERNRLLAYSLGIKNPDAVPFQAPDPSEIMKVSCHEFVLHF